MLQEKWMGKAFEIVGKKTIEKRVEERETYCKYRQEICRLSGAL